MKKIIPTLFFLLSFSISKAQNQGSITAKESKQKAGVTSHYIYQPPKNLVMPGKIQALVVYQNKQEFFSKTVRMDKQGRNYSFAFKAPDSTTVLVISITEPGKIIPDKVSLVREVPFVFDNNDEKGYIIYLHDKAGKRFAHEKPDLIATLDHIGWYRLGLKQKSDAFLIKMYEDSYKFNPDLKKHDSYVDYLLLKYKENEAAIRPELLDHANRLMKIQNDEKKWLSARYIFSNLKMTEEKNTMKEKILKTFPDGEYAKGMFWDNLKHDSTEKYMLAAMDTYIARFNDNSSKARDRFYASFISRSLINKDWSTAFKYGELLNEKILAAYQYDYNAWKLSGKQTDNPAIDLENAKILSARSITISTALMNDGADRDEDALRDLKEAHYNFYDTYALILYKLGKYDSAFYCQDLVSKQGKQLNTGGMERYAAYSEKVKGTGFTRQYIESKLSSGIKSPAMLKQLQSIYRELNLPENEFNRLQERSRLLVKQKNETAIKNKYGTLKARNFSLKNMLGETVSLSDLKNKIVVLDFWATWCSPCKASFPAMQALVDKYNDDKDIVFLFIDTWEEISPKHTAAVSQYMQDSKYSFNVLFDEKNQVSKDYKVGGLPQKIVIGKTGEMIFTSDDGTHIVLTGDEAVNEMSAIIDAAKRIPMNPTINNTKLPDPVFLYPKTKQ